MFFFFFFLKGGKLAKVSGHTEPSLHWINLTVIFLLGFVRLKAVTWWSFDLFYTRNTMKNDHFPTLNGFHLWLELILHLRSYFFLYFHYYNFTSRALSRVLDFYLPSPQLTFTLHAYFWIYFAISLIINGRTRAALAFFWATSAKKGPNSP